MQGTTHWVMNLMKKLMIGRVSVLQQVLEVSSLPVMRSKGVVDSTPLIRNYIIIIIKGNSKWSWLKIMSMIKQNKSIRRKIVWREFFQRKKRRKNKASNAIHLLASFEETHLYYHKLFDIIRRNDEVGF